MKPFAQWTDSDIAAHNAKVSGARAKATTQAEPEMRAPVLSTNLVLTKSTDEEKLNKLERSWLWELRRTNPQENVSVQSITLKLGDDCRYTPDFWTVDANGQLIFWETKGFRVRLGQAKIIIAARMFRHFRFILVEKKNGQWVETPIKP